VSAVFSKQSRYRLVPDVTVPDAHGRLVLVKDVRPLPEVTGTYRHTVDAGDRLDRLAWTYYGQPLLFWRICDANPDFLSPLALLGQEALVTTRFPVSVAAGNPPWSTLLADLTGTVGVDDVAVVEETTLEQQRRTVGADEVTVTVERPLRTVVVTYDRVNIDAAAVAAVIGAAGLTVGPPTDGGQVGRSIVVPVAAAG
jgi:hypothetical protein